MGQQIYQYSRIIERLVIDGETNSELVHQHIARYEFATKYVLGKRVLDIACGSGYGSSLLIEAGAASVQGVDISEESIGYAKEHYARNDVHFAVGSAEDLSSFGIFDVVISFETIEHLEHPEIFLTEITRVLTPEGILLISTPVRESGTLADRPKNHFHLREWSQDEFRELLQRYFKSVDMCGQYNFKKWFPYSRKLQRLFFKSFLPRHYDVINHFQLLTKSPNYAGFQFDMIYMIVICRTTIK